MNDTATVRMAGLHARDDRGLVLGLDLALPAGPVGALIGSPADGTTALGRVLCGLDRPTRGSLTVAEHAPFDHASTRRRIGALLGVPRLAAIGTVRDLFAIAARVRGGEVPRDGWYDELGIAALDGVSVAGLDAHQTRTVALGLALAVPSPVLLVLIEPLLALERVSADLLAPLLRERARSGACVVVLSSSAADAVALADDVATLQRGRIGRAIGAPDADALVPSCEVEVHVWTDKPRELSSALALEADIRAVFWEERGAGTPMVVKGAQLDACAAAIARAAADRGATLHAVRPTLPAAADVHEATLRMIGQRVSPVSADRSSATGAMT